MIKIIVLIVLDVIFVAVRTYDIYFNNHDNYGIINYSISAGPHFTVQLIDKRKNNEIYDITVLTCE